MPVREAPEVALIVYTVLMIAVTAGFLSWWLASPRERAIGLALPILLLGGFISGFMEPWLDNLVLVGWPPEQGLPTINAYERSVPIFVPIGYAWFCGGLLYVVARYLQRTGVTTKKVWSIYGIIGFVDFVAIGLSAWLGILEFFGDPPMKVLGFALWWAAIDGLFVTAAGVLVLLLLHHLRGLAQAWLVLVPSIMLGASAGIVGWPISTALNSSWSMPVKYLAALISIGLSLACIRFIARTAPGLELFSRRLARGGFPDERQTTGGER